MNAEERKSHSNRGGMERYVETRSLDLLSAQDLTRELSRLKKPLMSDLFVPRYTYNGT